MGSFHLELVLNQSKYLQIFIANTNCSFGTGPKSNLIVQDCIIKCSADLHTDEYTSYSFGTDESLSISAVYARYSFETRDKRDTII